jgi:hypothetical protein
LSILFSLFGVMALNAPATEANCNMTSAAGTDGRCFNVDGEFDCLERTEDEHCFTDAEPC